MAKNNSNKTKTTFFTKFKNSCNSLPAKLFLGFLVIVIVAAMLIIVFRSKSTVSDSVPAQNISQPTISTTPTITSIPTPTSTLLSYTNPNYPFLRLKYKSGWTLKVTETPNAVDNSMKSILVDISKNNVHWKVSYNLGIGYNLSSSAIKKNTLNLTPMVFGWVRIDSPDKKIFTYTKTIQIMKSSDANNVCKDIFNKLNIPQTQWSDYQACGTATLGDSAMTGLSNYQIPKALGGDGNHHMITLINIGISADNTADQATLDQVDDFVLNSSY
jgi:hypothetical protein